VAVIKKFYLKSNRHSGTHIMSNGDGVVRATPSHLQALTAAALVLPGLLQSPAHAAEEDSVDFQYSHYQEGKRDISGFVSNLATQTESISKLPNNLNPIEVDSLHGSSRISLTDRIKFSFNYTQDTWSGATPVGTAPAIVRGNRARYNSTSTAVTGASPIAGEVTSFYLDKNSNILEVKTDPSTGELSPGSINNQLTHVLATASPETRKQGDFKLGYEWDEAAVDVGGGISIENDYESRFVNLGGRMDFNQKQTTVNLGLSYTNSDTFATLDADSLQFISTTSYEERFSDEQSGSFRFKGIEGSAGQIESTYDSLGRRSGAVLNGNRQDWGTQLGLTQVLNKDAVLELNMGYIRSTGFMANPYKLVYAFNFEALPEQDLSQPLLFIGQQARIEIRPDERNQFNWNLGYNQYIAPLDAALHFDYRFAHDDWGINAHTFEADWAQPIGSGWTVTPRVRYYSQSGADFYTPFLTILTTGYDTPALDSNGDAILDGDGNPVTNHIDTTKVPKYYSSDQRLSGFGALSGGVTVAKQFAKGVSLETGFEYYTHQGSLKIGGGGEQDFANYDYWVANAALKINLESIGAPGGHTGHSNHHHASNAPAGVMFDHALEKFGDVMVGYRFMRSEQAGNMLLGSQAVSQDTVRFNGCGDQECAVAPNFMAMNMHMLDLMVAPTDWLTLMLMPQWVDMEMDMTPLDNTPRGGHNHGGAAHDHQTGGIGDTGVYALFKLLEQSGHHINLSLGGTAPTGDVEVTLRKTVTNPIPGTLIHYGMQLGSGTWDFKPSLTYTGEIEQLSWGAQVTGTKRLESRNDANFAFGDIFQGSVWGGYQWTNWLTTTVRSAYTQQGAIHGKYRPLFDEFGNPFTPTHIGPFDTPANYGGQFVDLGLGINVTVPNGAFAGNTLKFEWLQPLHTDYNGYQLDRDGALSATWSIGF